MAFTLLVCVAALCAVPVLLYAVWFLFFARSDGPGSDGDVVKAVLGAIASVIFLLLAAAAVEQAVKHADAADKKTCDKKCCDKEGLRGGLIN